jgi:hypothetical protein
MRGRLARMASLCSNAEQVVGAGMTGVDSERLGEQSISLLL